jgi:hypothetical protein
MTGRSGKAEPMELIWKLDQTEIARLQSFVAGQMGNPFVRGRISHNVENPPAAVSVLAFWEVLVGCLLTSQQRSGPDSPVSRLLATTPFPLSYDFYLRQADPVTAAEDLLSGLGGIRFKTRISGQLARNFGALGAELWESTEQVLRRLYENESPAEERRAAEFMAASLAGIGPKQSRNLLQGLGLTKYEIPIDSRITKWLNAFGFPIVLSATGLADVHYYNFVSDGIQAMCRQCEVLPCIFDAAVFSSFDGDGWTEDNLVW